MQEKSIEMRLKGNDETAATVLGAIKMANLYD